VLSAYLHFVDHHHFVHGFQHHVLRSFRRIVLFIYSSILFLVLLDFLHLFLDFVFHLLDFLNPFQYVFFISKRMLFHQLIVMQLRWGSLSCRVWITWIIWSFIKFVIFDYLQIQPAAIHYFLYYFDLMLRQIHISPLFDEVGVRIKGQTIHHCAYLPQYIINNESNQVVLIKIIECLELIVSINKNIQNKNALEKQK